jgi:hypothetical protein
VHLTRQRRSLESTKRQRDGVLGQPELLKGELHTELRQAARDPDLVPGAFQDASQQAERRGLPFAPAAAAKAHAPDRFEPFGLRTIGQCLCRPARERDPVGIGVVNLAVDGEAAVVQPVDDVVFPQRAAAIELRRVELRDQRVERGSVQRLLGLVQEQVIVEVEALHRPPTRSAQSEKVDDLVEGLPRAPVGPQLVVQPPRVARRRVGRRLQDRQAGDVFRAVLGLDDEKCQIDQ